MDDDLLAGVEFSSPHPGVILINHSPEVCAGSPCCIHAPSTHHMTGWPMTFRSDRPLLCPTHGTHALVLTERVCCHGCGHPDPDSLAWLLEHDPFDDGAWGAHGCDRCCRDGAPNNQPQ